MAAFTAGQSGTREKRNHLTLCNFRHSMSHHTQVVQKPPQQKALQTDSILSVYKQWGTINDFQLKQCKPFREERASES